ncbi:hypothetical protein BD414DRAFT_486981 [Trametes punicea]|nr:hypothetical protein BD414DRAFT_486981 [Trametes punicea]
MSSYYREHVSFPNVTSGPAPPYPPSVTAPDNAANNFTQPHRASPDNANGNGAAQSAQDDSATKRCSVKGCAAPLPPAYPHKMCEECRGRHRVYATTKRAKRKMEKALLNNAQAGQPVVWMPDEDLPNQERDVPQQSLEPVPGPSRPYEVSSSRLSVSLRQYDHWIPSWFHRPVARIIVFSQLCLSVATSSMTVVTRA